MICFRKVRNRHLGRDHLYRQHYDEYILNQHDYDHMLERYVERATIKEESVDVAETPNEKKEVGHNTDRMICYICNGTFQTRKNLNSHIAKFHTDDKYECKICKKSIMGKTKGREHLYVAHHEEYTANIDDLDS